MARTLAEPVGKALGQTLIVNNRPGAATNIGAADGAKAKADGHVTLTADTAILAASPSLSARLSYSAEKDFAPVGLMARFAMLVVVNAGVPVKTLAAFQACWQWSGSDVDDEQSLRTVVRLETPSGLPAARWTGGNAPRCGTIAV